MSWGHLHLMLNHLPVLGAPALLALLAWGPVRGPPDVTRIALWFTVALAEEMVERSRREAPRPALTRLVLIGLLASTLAVGVTAWTGGPIGHPELRTVGVSER